MSPKIGRPEDSAGAVTRVAGAVAAATAAAAHGLATRWSAVKPVLRSSRWHVLPRSHFVLETQQSKTGQASGKAAIDRDLTGFLPSNSKLQKV